jgi:hypothetical protein
MAFGLYPTIGDLVKIAALFAQGGAQILNRANLADVPPGPGPRGLPTGNPIDARYHKAFWHAQHRSEEGCTIWYPMMRGWGGGGPERSEGTAAGRVVHGDLRAAGLNG